MKRLNTLAIFVAILALAAPAAFGQFDTSGTTTLSLTVGPEAALTVTATTPLTTAGGGLFADYTGSTTFIYKIRTALTGGNASITAAVTREFETGGPSVAAGDLKYTCAVVSPGNGCTGTMTAGTAPTSVATFGANSRSAREGTESSVAWTLFNDPQVQTGNYSAQVTFTIANL
jgi:hypothetical protein